MRAFPSLRRLTGQVPGAREAVRWALDGGRQVVIATNPCFPHRHPATDGVGGLIFDELPIDLVTTYENMHATRCVLRTTRSLPLGWRPASA
jgi:hypothetical protein